MNFPEVLPAITAALDKATIPYMLSGSFASAYYGALRSTQDIDLVISATPPQIRAFVASLPPSEYYADVDAALEAHQRESLFNVIDLKTGWKVDLIIRKSRSFSQEEFGRRQKITVEDTSLVITSLEDIIIAKLEWSKLAQSQRQIEDAAGLLKLRRDDLDRTYLNKWIRELRLAEQWDHAQRSAGLRLDLGE